MIHLIHIDNDFANLANILYARSNRQTNYSQVVLYFPHSNVTIDNNRSAPLVWSTLKQLLPELPGVHTSGLIVSFRHLVKAFDDGTNLTLNLHSTVLLLLDQERTDILAGLVQRSLNWSSENPPTSDEPQAANEFPQ